MNLFPGKISNLGEILRWRSSNQPNKIAYIFLEDSDQKESILTFEDLDKKAQTIAFALQEQNAVGERALLLYPPGLEYIHAFYACLYAGVISVPVYPPDPARLNRTLPRLQAIIKDSQAKFVLTTQAVLTLAETFLGHSPELKALQWIATDNLGIFMDGRDWSIDSNNLAFLQYTSGSTGSPKGVMITHRNLMENGKMIYQIFQPNEQTVTVGWLPMYHDLGLIGMMLPAVYVGMPLIFMSPLSFLRRPIRWLQAITRYKANVSGGPNFAYDLCVRRIKPEERATLDLSSWRTALCGAEPIRSQTIKNFCEYFEPSGFSKKSFYPCYGLAEATLMVTGGRPNSSPLVKKIKKSFLKKGDQNLFEADDKDCQELVCCGQPIGDQLVYIVDPETRLKLPQGQIGEIWVQGKNVAQGYWNHPSESKFTFQAHLEDTGEGPFLRTGDLGFMTGEGLFITGRLKDLIVLFGENHYPQDIELIVENSHPAARKGCGAAFSLEKEGIERLVIAQEIDILPEVDLKEIESTIRDSVIQEQGVEVYRILLIGPKSIPKTSSGKIQRQACKEEFLSGNLEILNP